MTAPNAESEPIVEAEYEDIHDRRRLLRYSDKLVMTYERRRLGDGWYVRDFIELPLPPS